MRLARKGSGVPSVTYAELVEAVLCFGWIDGKAQRLDETSYLQRITPRRRRSVWSQKNVAAVQALTAAGRMRPAGLAAIEADRADGRWERAYPGPATATVPEDLAAARTDQSATDGRSRQNLASRRRHSSMRTTPAAMIPTPMTSGGPSPSQACPV